MTQPTSSRPPRGRHGSPVAVVANPSAELYGSDRMMLETVRGLVGQGWRVVVAASQSGPLVDELVAAGATVEIVPVPVVRKANLSPQGMVELLRDTGRGLRPMVALLRRERPDALYVSTVTVPFWLPLARLLRIPVLCHVHEGESSIPTPIKLALAAPTALANHVVYNSEQSRIVGRLPLPRWDRKVSRVYNGVPGPSQAPTPPRETLDGGPRLVYVGRLSPRKGVDLAVAALGLLHERGIPASLDLVGAVFAGYEWYERELRDQVAALGLTEHVQFHGFQPDVWPWLDRADIALVPSRGDESFGNVLVEASLAARPIVAADHTGLREARAGRAAAVAVRIDDAVALADGIARIVESWSDYRAKAIEDRPRAQEAYAPARYQREMADTVARTAKLS